MKAQYKKIAPTKEMILEKISHLEASVKYKLAEIEKLKASL
jgi:hypothetical protein